MIKSKIILCIAWIFLILTFLGTIYVYTNNVNAGYAVIPSVFCIIFQQWYIQLTNKNIFNKEVKNKK